MLKVAEQQPAVDPSGHAQMVEHRHQEGGLVVDLPPDGSVGSILAHACRHSRSAVSSSDASPSDWRWICHWRCFQARSVFSAVSAPETSVSMAVLARMKKQQNARDACDVSSS